MKVTFKNIVILLLVGLMILGVIMPIFAESDVPFTDETYWNNTCEGFGYNENEADCSAYKQHLLSKIKDNNANLADIKVNLDTIREDIKKYADEVQTYATEIKTLEADAKAIQASIDAAQLEVERLELLIQERILNIEEKEERVKEYIALSQSQFRVNGYIEFVMGAKDFSDIVMRMEGLNRIKVFNEGLIAELKEERIALEEDKESVIVQQEKMRVEKEILDAQIVYTESLKAQSDKLLAQLHTLEAEAEAKADSIATAMKLDKDKADSLKAQIESVVPSGSWTNPINGSYSLVNKGWYYTSGASGPHNGTDLGVSSGTPIVAVASGVVATTQNGCGPGYLGNTCGYSYGNRVNLIVNVDGVVYGVVYAHLLGGSLRVSDTQTVEAGQVIALSGNSGSSTGPHLHIEIIRFDETEIIDALKKWGNSPNFGTGSASSSSRRICESPWNYSAPCRIDPAKIFGY